MPFAGRGLGSDAMGTAWETPDKPALPHPWHSPIRSAPAELLRRGFARVVQILPQSQARNVFWGAPRAWFLLGLVGFKESVRAGG